MTGAVARLPPGMMSSDGSMQNAGDVDFCYPPTCVGREPFYTS
jgi:hypothetical protein